MDFVGDGLCAQTDPEVFFPDKGEGATSRAAKAVCQRCPVLAKCEEWTLSQPESSLDGIFGGMTKRDRLARRKQMGR